MLFLSYLQYLAQDINSRHSIYSEWMEPMFLALQQVLQGKGSSHLHWIYSYLKAYKWKQFNKSKPCAFNSRQGHKYQTMPANTEAGQSWEKEEWLAEAAQDVASGDVGWVLSAPGHSMLP